MNQAFQFKVSLTHVPSGKTVEFEETWDFPGYVRGEDWEFDPVYLWADGNYSCNCNRDLFFRRVTEPSYSHSSDTRQCREFDEYRVNWIRNLETGEVIYEEPCD